jgi:hypothetical protein
MAMADGRLNWLILGLVGVVVVNLLNLGIAVLYGIVEHGYSNIVILVSMLLTSAVLAITWGLYNRSQAQGRISAPIGNEFESRDRRRFTESAGQENGTMILPFDVADEEGEDVAGYGYVPYSTKIRTGAIRCKRCLLINEASREGQTCKHCGTYLLFKQ